MSTITKITEKGWFDWTVQERKLLLQNNIFVASFFSFMLFTLCKIYFEIASLHLFERSGNVLICGTDSIRAVWTRSIFPTKIVSEWHLSAKREYGLNSFLEIFRFFISSFKGLYAVWHLPYKRATCVSRWNDVKYTWCVCSVEGAFCENSCSWYLFSQKALSWMFDWVLNMPLIKQGYLLLNNAILHTFYLL